MIRPDTGRARNLRRNQTVAEKALWLRLRDKQLEGLKFRRQHPIGSYIVDFVNLDKRLIIEIDGGHHNEPLTETADVQRTKDLEAMGYQVVRFWNNDILQNIDGVTFKIKEHLSSVS